MSEDLLENFPSNQRGQSHQEWPQQGVLQGVGLKLTAAYVDISEQPGIWDMVDGAAGFLKKGQLD